MAATGTGWAIVVVDVKKAHLHTVAVRTVHVVLPLEIRQPGKCARLLRCLYGTRDAAEQWEASYTTALINAGFVAGSASFCCFVHKTHDLCCVVRGGDDFTFHGTPLTLNQGRNGERALVQGR